MAKRRGIPKVEPVWYLREWMAATGHGARGGQTWLMNQTGWSRATTSQLMNGEQDLDSRYIEEAAKALNIEKHELLMHPEDAMALRQMRQLAQQIVHVDRVDLAPEPSIRATGTHG